MPESPYEFITSPGLRCIATLEFDNGMTVKGDVHNLSVHMSAEDWPNIDLSMHALEIKVGGEKGQVEDLIRVIRFRNRRPEDESVQTGQGQD